MTALSARLAAARPEETRELLIELRKQTSSFSGDCLSDEYLEWARKKDAFWRKLDAEAYESAVLMLVPEGWRLSTLTELTNGEWTVHLNHKDDPEHKSTIVASNCATAALALALAAAVAGSVE